MGQMTEILSLYADNMLLYFQDSGPSLAAALKLIKQFGEYSGLQINWCKSQILPLKLHAPSASQAALPFVRASQIKYLGVQCSRAPADYIGLNLEPLFALRKTMTQVWSRHPLGVTGRIHLVKMILLPKLLYLFWHAPLYIPP